MIRAIKAERLKYRRTFSRRLILLSPLFFIATGFVQKGLLPPSDLKPWALHLTQSYNWWTVIFVPLGTALFAALVELQEKKAGNYRSLRVHPVSPSFLWTGKIVLMSCHVFLAALVFMFAVILSGLVTGGGKIPWTTIVAGGLAMWLASLPLIPVQLWASAWKGAFFSMAVGFAGMIAGVAAAPGAHWIYVPWSWPIRLMCPIVGVHPNGVSLAADDPLRNPSAIPTGLALSVLAFLILTMVTAMWFQRRDVH